MIAQKVAVNKRTANSVDVEIGQRIHALREKCGLSQLQLGKLIGVGFRQIQKYEKGANRVPAGRLHQLAEVLKVPVTFFYVKSTIKNGKGDSVFLGLAYLETAGAIRLVRAFSRIYDPKMRRILVDLTEKLAD